MPPEAADWFNCPQMQLTNLSVGSTVTKGVAVGTVVESEYGTKHSMRVRWFRGDLGYEMRPEVSYNPTENLLWIQQSNRLVQYLDLLFHVPLRSDFLLVSESTPSWRVSLETVGMWIQKILNRSRAGSYKDISLKNIQGMVELLNSSSEHISCQHASAQRRISIWAKMVCTEFQEVNKH